MTEWETFAYSFMLRQFELLDYYIPTYIKLFLSQFSDLNKRENLSKGKKKKEAFQLTVKGKIAFVPTCPHVHISNAKTCK